ncbi:protease, insulinase family/protease, insulinase family [Vulgatibacter incomptus]|uniref:Protease, insulinase family/protease, insulinase family n=2 Tax=Vulgatibacter incomptus TaxID=1391653 RepID=A0A0K1P9E1_9BACT|nr:protease, insulinase family/protease, insulinase family [Vulgatibacter incomptus]
MLAPVALLSLALPAAAVAASPAPQPANEDVALAIPFEKYTLPNGLEVILSEDHQLPVVAVNVWYHVGAFHEQPGRTGFAHLFEHMMFQGSKHVADDAHIAMLERIGATALNGTTNFDRTNYFETVPSHHFETALWLESDRMGFLLDALTAEKLKLQQEVVKNERRQSIETAPYGLAEEKAWQALFPSPHPYFGSVIGSMEDLDAATMDDVADFFRTWYAPSNATLTIVGDFEPGQAKALVEKYFGTLRSHPKPLAPSPAPAALSQAVELRLEEPVASLPKVEVMWHSPALFAEGDAVADVLASTLSSGKSSRLYQRLVFEKKLAQSVQASQQSLGAQSVFSIEAVARPGVTTDQLLAEIDAVLDQVRKDGVRDDEIRRVRNRFKTGRISGLQSVGGFGGKADLLQSYNHHLGDPARLAYDLGRYDEVTGAQVREFAGTVLAPDRRVILHAAPASAAQDAKPAKAAQGAR